MSDKVAKGENYIVCGKGVAVAPSKPSTEVEGESFLVSRDVPGLGKVGNRFEGYRVDGGETGKQYGGQCAGGGVFSDDGIEGFGVGELVEEEAAAEVAGR